MVLLAEGVRFTTPRFVALVVIVGAFSQSAAVAEQMRRADTLSIGVTVAPICTIAVTPGEWTADGAVNLACRNLPENHPEPLVTPMQQSGIESVPRLSVAVGRRHELLTA
jgi:hypothetical protein